MWTYICTGNLKQITLCFERNFLQQVSRRNLIQHLQTVPPPYAAISLPLHSSHRYPVLCYKLRHFSLDFYEEEEKENEAKEDDFICWLHGWRRNAVFFSDRDTLVLTTPENG